MNRPVSNDICITSAIGTPLNPDQSLDVPALKAHIDDQFCGGITDLLVAGTMGLMQLLTESAYRGLVAHAIELADGRGAVLIGAGDASFARTRDRISFLNKQNVDGIVLLSPYLVTFGQDELITYFESLADHACHPVFLYDLPGLTGTKLELPTVCRLAQHKNIHGIKCSGEIAGTRNLIDAVPDGFRVIVANPEIVDLTLRWGMRDQLDGVFAIAPRWTRELVDAGNAGDWDRAAAIQQRLNALLATMRRFGIFQSFTAILNARGVGGDYAPLPMRRLSDAERTTLLAIPVVRELIETCSVPTAAGLNGRSASAGVA